MKQLLIYSFQVKRDPVHKNGILIGHDTIEKHTAIFETEDDMIRLLDPEITSACMLIGTISKRELEESYNRLISP